MNLSRLQFARILPKLDVAGWLVSIQGVMQRLLAAGQSMRWASASPAQVRSIAAGTGKPAQADSFADPFEILATSPAGLTTLTVYPAAFKVLAAPAPAAQGSAAASPLLGTGYTTTTTLTYTYDPLNRLTRADYSDGTYFRYTYDAVGNRLAEETTGGTVNSSTYDSANRLTSVDGVAYTWDANGNLLSDGVNTYIYTNNKLSSITGNNLNITFQYNGLGKRFTGCTHPSTLRMGYDHTSGSSFARAHFCSTI